MPKILLTQQFSDNPPIVQHKTKTDYFDTRLTGFFLEVRASGKATYYQRYRDRHGRNRQVRLGPADAMTIEAARKSEASQARWENVNLETGMWIVPVSKSGKPRYIPLSAQPHQDITPFCFGKTYPLTEPTPKGKIPP
jgi:hypothetical protein